MIAREYYAVLLLFNLDTFGVKFRFFLLIAPFLLHRSTLHCYSVPWQTAT